jgi:D-2-hydroxyglutarate dehydrogenase
LHDDDLAFFRETLGDSGVVTGEDALEPYNRSDCLSAHPRRRRSRARSALSRSRRTTLTTPPNAPQPPTPTQTHRDWIGKYRGQATVALRPQTTDQVSRVLRHCNARSLAVCPQGGNTGLVGGSVPVFDEVVLSTSRMRQIMDVDPDAGAIVAQAGVTLQELDEAAAQRGMIFPLDLGAKGSCMLGGNLSTNAGGLRYLRYGSLRGSVLGLEAVLADGTVLDLLRTLRKDNTGYDLRQLFVGSEGTLGVITAAAVACPARPLSVQLAFLAVPSFEGVRAVLRGARRMLGEVLSAVEFLDAESMRMATAYLDGVRDPLAGAGGGGGGGGAGAGGSGGGSGSSSGALGGGQGQDRTHPFYMLIETSGSNREHDAQKLEAFLSWAMGGCEGGGGEGGGIVSDGVLAESVAQGRAIWRAREGVTEALARRGAVYKYDVSVPLARMYELVEAVRQRLGCREGGDVRLSASAGGNPSGSDGGVRVVGYGHVGDGNLHLNVSAPGPYDKHLLARLEPFIFEWVRDAGGSVSAEHGLGLQKAKAIGYSKPLEAVRVMRALKEQLDPKGILNPYKVVPPEGCETGDVAGGGGRSSAAAEVAGVAGAAAAAD